MPKPQTQMVTGQRGAREAEDNAAAAQEQAKDALVQRLSQAARTADVTDGPVRFSSRFKAFRLQITSPDDYKDANGRVIRGKPKVARFDNYSFVTSDPEIIKAIREYPRYGVEVFETAVVEKAARQAQVANVVAQVNNDPEFRRQLLSVLENGDDFTMPTAGR